MTPSPRRLPGVLLAFVLLGALALADVLHMKDGRRVEGKILSESAKVVRIKTRLGELEFKTSEIERIERKKSKLEEFEERWEAARTAQAFHDLGQWAEERKMRREARRCMKRALELDPGHAGANRWLGFVEYKGEWMKPEERERRMQADKEAELRARGLVRYGERWVTVEEREKLEAGLVLHDGAWIPFEEAQRLKGLAEFRGRWIRAGEAAARLGSAAASAVAGEPFETAVGELALVAGPLPLQALEQILAGTERVAAWYGRDFGRAPDLELLGGRLAELYVFPRGSGGYKATVAHFGALTPTVPEGWAEAAARSSGFWWIDPFALSSADQGHRNEDGLEGHCYHHFGHMLLNRTGYEGRLLPPWYDESYAALAEFEAHGRNAVFCRARASVSGGTNAARAEFGFDPKLVREGKWREALRMALDAKRVATLPRLTSLEFSDLTVLDVATGMAILEWIASHGDEALPAFHAELRAAAPVAPLRVLEDAQARTAAYERAFQAAAGMGWREADKAWREHFLSR